MNEDLIAMQQNEQSEAIDNSQNILSIAQKRTGALDKIMELAIQATNSNDWVEQNKTPYLMGSGAEKVMRRFALRIWDVQSKRMNATDDTGDYYYFETSGKVGFNEKEYIEVLGTCSARDNFFALRGGELLPIKDVDITNIKKKSYTNFLVNGVTRFLGIRNLTWEELNKYQNINRKKVAKVEYKSGKKASQWTDEHKKKAQRIGNYLLADCDGDKKCAESKLKEFTTFKAKDGKTVSGKEHMKNLSGKQIDILFKKLQKGITEFENAGKETEKKTDTEKK